MRRRKYDLPPVSDGRKSHNTVAGSRLFVQLIFCAPVNRAGRNAHPLDRLSKSHHLTCAAQFSGPSFTLTFKLANFLARRRICV